VSWGRRATDWELKGVPVRLEVGPRDLAEGVATLVRRIVDGGDERKSAVKLTGVTDAVTAALDHQQRALLDRSREVRESRTADVATLDEARDAAGDGWARLPWAALGPEGEAELAQAGISVRCLTRPDGTLPDTDDEPDLVAVVARAY
jgi:prolyl-tRNA synthetase